QVESDPRTRERGALPERRGRGVALLPPEDGLTAVLLGEGCASRVEGITTKRRRSRNPSRAPYSFDEAPDSACRVPRFFSRARVKFTGTRRVLLVRELKYVERHCSRVALHGLSVGFHLGAWKP